ncbi:MAG: cation-translocating P-type ATPase, partial [Oscillospiraceae bacterium]
ESENEYVFVGLISMIDPPREESKEAVANATKAGIRTIMITGDHKITATAIAKQIGIFREGDIAVTGVELQKFTDQELNEKLENISVYARVSPEHKIRIVNAWQGKGHIVSMTGDGVNDAPALKKANIGIAMGITGTEVSKDAAAMILTDDNFATIIKAVENGRNVYANIKNSIKFLLSGNTAGILCVLFTSLLGLPVPFVPVHLLFINLLTDSLPAIAIGVEPSNSDVLSDKPRDPKDGILSKDFLLRIGVEGSIIAVFTIIAYYMGLATSPALASSMAFATLTLARLFHGFNCRGTSSIFKLKLLSNKASVLAFVGGTALLSLVLFVPFLQQLFEVVSMKLSQLGMILGLSFAPTIIIQAYKVIRENIKGKNH